MGGIVSRLVSRCCRFAVFAATLTVIDVSPVNAEPNAVIETGAREMRRILEENWANTEFVMLLAGIAAFALYFLTKSTWLSPSKDQGLKDTSSQKDAAVKPRSSPDFRSPAGKPAIGEKQPVTREEIEEEFAKVSEANYRPDPVEDDATENLLKVVFKGAKWGFVAGCAVAMVYIQIHTPASLGFYPGDAGVVLFACIGPGAAIGALLVWLGTLISDDKILARTVASGMSRYHARSRDEFGKTVFLLSRQIEPRGLLAGFGVLARGGGSLECRLDFIRRIGHSGRPGSSG